MARKSTGPQGPQLSNATEWVAALDDRTPRQAAKDPASIRQITFL